jgi:homoaconitase/3-isopropylmalate dehydratase large subunit
MSAESRPAGRTLFDKVWSRHVVADLGEGFTLLHVDRHVLQDFNGNSFKRMAERGLRVRNPELTFATPDHSVSTDTIGFADGRWGAAHARPRGDDAHSPRWPGDCVFAAHVSA